MHPFSATRRALLQFTATSSILAGGVLASCAAPKDTAAADAGSSGSPTPAVGEVAAQPGSLEYDRNQWLELLAANSGIRRTVRFSEQGVDATTESDDPKIAAKIIEHAQAMQARMRTGARVRGWDPVFVDLFNKHEVVKLEVTPTERGVTIVERSSDAEAVRLLHAHALGVNEFVRSGMKAARRPTTRLVEGDPVPIDEVAIGGVSQRFLVGQPTAAQSALLKRDGVGMVINYRPARENPKYDEQAAVTAAGMDYRTLPYASPAELTDELFDSTRSALREAAKEGEVVALHCRSGSRSSTAWVGYRVLDQNIPIDQAIAEARVLQMRGPEMEAKAREYVERRRSILNPGG